MIDTAHPTALYEQVAQALEKQILAGTLRPGDRVPSVRRSSQQHRVSVTTAVQAYLSLENRGLIEARPKSGFYVRVPRRVRFLEPKTSRPGKAATNVGVGILQSPIFDEERVPGVVPLGAALPSPELLPVTKLNRMLAAIARRSGARGLSYDMPPGAEPLRREVARRSMDWGTNLTPDDLITTCGGTEALALCLRAVTKPGDVVAIESPTYFGVLQAIENFGLKALEIPTHPRTGMDLDALELALKKQRVAACLVIPNFNNPLGSLMPDEHKRRLVDLVTRRGLPLIEDDIYGDLHFGAERPRVVRSYDESGLVMLCSSFSKTLAPGYRVGWVAPGRFYERVKSLKLTSTLATATLPELAVAEFVANGGYDAHLRSIRRTYAEQIQQVSHAIEESFPPETTITRPEGGFVLWVGLPPNVSALKLHERALAEKISIAPGPMFSAKGQFANFIRVSCGHPWTGATERAIGVLSYLVKKMC